MEPRVYKIGTVYSIISVVLIAALGLAAIGGIVIFFGALLSHHRDLAGLVLGIPLSLAMIGLIAVIPLPQIRKRVFLYPDAIEVESLYFGRRRLERKDIGAKTIVPFLVGGSYVFFPRTKRQRGLIVSFYISLDSIFHDWMKDIPDADQAFHRARRNDALEARIPG